MPENDLEPEIDTLAHKIEEAISRSEERVESHPDFAPRSSRSRKMRNAVVDNGR
jgi:hypothetical protein